MSHLRHRRLTYREMIPVQIDWRSFRKNLASVRTLNMNGHTAMTLVNDRGYAAQFRLQRRNIVAFDHILIWARPHDSRTCERCQNFGQSRGLALTRYHGGQLDWMDNRQVHPCGSVFGPVAASLCNIA
jgi:hypothetical protein